MNAGTSEYVNVDYNAKKQGLFSNAQCSLRTYCDHLTRIRSQCIKVAGFLPMDLLRLERKRFDEGTLKESFMDNHVGVVKHCPLLVLRNSGNSCRFDWRKIFHITAAAVAD